MTSRSTILFGHWPSQIIKDILAKCPEEVGAAMGQVNALKQVVRRIQKGSTSKNPSCMEEIPVPLPEDFAKEVIYDNERSDRLIIFATEPGISLMGDAEELFMDGTHTIKGTRIACYTLFTEVLQVKSG